MRYPMKNGARYVKIMAGNLSLTRHVARNFLKAVGILPVWQQRETDYDAWSQGTLLKVLIGFIQMRI
jgi:hypothetical protein